MTQTGQPENVPTLTGDDVIDSDVIEFEDDEEVTAQPGLAAILEGLTTTTVPRDTRMVAPVGVQGDQRPGNSNLLLTQIVKEESLPKFSGEIADFDEFQWKFSRHMETIETIQGTTIPDKIKLLILEKTLPEHDKKWMQLLLRKGEPLSYRGFMAKLATKAGSNKETQAREKWNTLTFRSAGKVTCNDFFKFEMEFRQAQQGLGNLTEEECYRHLMSKLPASMSTWVIEEEVRLRTTCPKLIVELPIHYTDQAILDCIKKVTGATPATLKRNKPGEFVATFVNWEDAKKMLDMHGKKLRGLDHVFKVQEVLPKMAVDQVFDLVKLKLEGRERGDQLFRMNRSNLDRYRSPLHDSRYVRVTSTTPSPPQERGGEVLDLQGPTQVGEQAALGVLLHGSELRIVSPTTILLQQPQTGRGTQPQRPRRSGLTRPLCDPHHPMQIHPIHLQLFRVREFGRGREKVLGMTAKALAKETILGGTMVAGDGMQMEEISAIHHGMTMERGMGKVRTILGAKTISGIRPTLGIKGRGRERGKEREE